MTSSGAQTNAGGTAAAATGSVSAALDHALRLLALQPALAKAQAEEILRAAVLARVGDYDKSIEVYERLLADRPEFPKAWLSYGHALKTAGRQADCISAYRRSLQIAPGLGEAYWSLANLKTVRMDDGDVAQMEGQLNRVGLDESDRLHLHYALGKALEDRGDYAASFEHYRQGAALRRSQVGYDADDVSAETAKARAIYTAELFADRAGWGAPAPDPIFIIGLPRSGSTLVEQILSSHSAVEGTMELPDLAAIARGLEPKDARGDTASYHDGIPALTVEAIRALGEDYLGRTRVYRKSARPLFIDKMPNNFQHVGLIQLILPNARIVDARRHPLATCFSAFKQHFARGQHFSYDLADLGRYYADYVALMRHFDRVTPGRIHRVLYERMVDDCEGETRRLLDYCGLEFEPSCLRFFENDRAVRTASSEQVRQPIFRDGLDQWRHYEPWLGSLKAALGPTLDAYPEAP